MERKEIITALVEYFGVKPKYMGMPTCAYELATQQGTYTIDLAGKIKNSEGVAVELESLINGKVDEAASAPAETENISFEVAVPMEGHTGSTLRNLVNMVFSKQALIKKSFGLSANIVEDAFSVGINAAKMEILADFEKAVEDLGTQSCPGIAFDFVGNCITFKFLEGIMSSEMLKAYTQLVALLNQNAMVLKHASAKVIITDNDKFTFRIFLVKLGMIGDSYKITRKVLLENLKGNSAFKGGSKPEKVAAE